MAGDYRVRPGRKVRMKDFDPADTDGVIEGHVTETRMIDDLARLGELQELLYAAHSHSVLVVLQGIDTAGKDGTIRHVFTGINPQSCNVACFKQPTPLEADHDYLWRIHAQTPARGEIVIFNRSYYESVLVERVHKLVPKDVWKARYDEINRFERLLIDAGTIVIKLFLNLSYEEQERRLRAREAAPMKRWKIGTSDWVERKLWAEYQRAYADMLSQCSTKDAPWYVIPSDHKWYRNYVVSNLLTDRLQPFRAEWTKTVLARGAQQIKVENAPPIKAKQA